MATRRLRTAPILCRLAERCNRVDVPPVDHFEGASRESEDDDRPQPKARVGVPNGISTCCKGPFPARRVGNVPTSANRHTAADITYQQFVEGYLAIVNGNRVHVILAVFERRTDSDPETPALATTHTFALGSMFLLSAAFTTRLPPTEHLQLNPANRP